MGCAWGINIVIKKFGGKMLSRCLCNIKTTFHELIFDVYVLSDKTKKIIYITSSGTTQYFIEKICDNDVTIDKIKRIYVWQLREFVKKQDTVLIDMHKSFTRFFNDGFLIPPFVRQILYIDGPINEVIKIKNNDLKKTHKYSYDILNDTRSLKFFYEKMYVPHIKKRFGDSAYIENFDNLQKILKKGELLFIKFNGEYVSAALCEVNNGTYFLRKNGVLDESFVEDGALLATYYFPILRAKEINAKMVDFGQSRPFLSDGVLRHKNLWGTIICEDKGAKRVIYLKNIFEQPFICIEDEKLKAVVFSKEDKLIKEYARSGLDFKIVDRNR